MQRYNQYGPTDAPPVEEGDLGFIGVNTFDAAEALKQGEMQEAINMDFSQAAGQTRGGFVCLPELGINPFSSGTTWTTENASADRAWSSVAYGNGTFVAVSSTGGGVDVMWSLDGVTWSSVTTGYTNAWTAVTFGNGLFVAVANSGTGNRVMTSPDGINWTRRTSAADLAWTCVTYGNGVYVALASDTGQTGVMTSTNGTNWTQGVTTQDFITSGGDFFVTSGGSRFAYVRGSIPITNGKWYGVTYGNGIFVAVGQDASAYVMTSFDGYAWVVQVGALAKLYTSVAFGKGVFVAVSSDGAASAAMYSTDGVTWTSAVTPNTTAATWNNVAFGNNYFVAVSNAGVATANQAMTSTDGINWISQTSAAAHNWNAVVAGANTFIAVASTGTTTRVMLSAQNHTVWASGTYSDPNAATDPWIVMVGTASAGFYSFGQTSRTVNYPAGYTISQQSTVVQANNQLYIFSGSSQSPIYWDGTWGGAFVTVPLSTLGVGYMDMPYSNHALYYQNRLWVIDGKDTYAASQSLDFRNFNELTGSFNLNVGSSENLVTSYPFGDNAIVVFKNRSSYMLQNVDGALTNVTSTEISRQLGIIGINACCAAGPDIIYMSDRNISSIKLNLTNKLQGVTQPLSRNIPDIMKRINWAYAYKVSMGFWNNQLFVALPLDNSTVCNTILVYNFVTEAWFGEWNFDPSISMAIEGFVVANNLGQLRLHIVTEDGRIFYFGSGQNDISGNTVAEISTSLTTRAYRMDNNSKIARRMYADLSLNRPTVSAVAYVEGANEYSNILTNQTYSRADSWIFNDSTYDLTNANDDYNRAYRKDYSSGPDSVQCGTGFLPEMTQNMRLPLLTRRKGRLAWFKVTNSTGFILINGVGYEGRAGDRSSLTQVG